MRVNYRLEWGITGLDRVRVTVFLLMVMLRVVDFHTEPEKLTVVTLRLPVPTMQHRTMQPGTLHS